MTLTARLRGYVKTLLPRPLLLALHRYQAAKYVQRLQPAYSSGRKTVLILNHFFSQDIQALEVANSGFNLIVVESDQLFHAARLFFSPSVVNLLAAYADENAASVANYRKYCRFVLEALTRRFQIDAILTASDIFFWVREFIAVGRERGIKTVVLDKEGTISPHDFEFESARIRRFAPFMSDHILVWSVGQQAFWEKVGVPAAKITVTGQPRSDLFFRTNGRVRASFATPRPLITFFSYLDTAYIPVPLVAEHNLTWANMKRETHDELRRCAIDYPGYNFVIKVHPQQEDLASLQESYTTDNLRVVGGSAIANQLIAESVLLIGFQTTAIIEAMFLDKPIIYTAWDDNIGRLQDHLLPFHTAAGLVVANTLHQFRSLCDDFCQGRRDAFVLSESDKRARETFVNQYLRKPDGRAGERVFRALQQIV